MWRTRREVATRGHLAAIVQSTEDAVASFDLDGRVLSWNAGATSAPATPPARVAAAGARVRVWLKRNEHTLFAMDLPEWR